MCKQVQSVTLQTAIFMQAKEFAASNVPFSVHDITRILRVKTAQGELEIPEVEVSGASFRFDIPHAKVKALFDELDRTSAFDADFTTTRTFNGMYFEYTPQLVGNVSASPAPASTTPVATPNYPGTSTASPAPVPGPVSTSSTPHFIHPVSRPVTSDSLTEIQGRIKLYLTNCANRNFRPRLKQLQSAIKRHSVSTGISCEELKFMVQNLGFTVVDDPESVSRAQVATI